ncbi:cytochrome P450 90B1-like [Cocos nucifera]|uniref:Cytochrome P450 90B1-like n=1 Tax=Cocos nucifera TaxID=13894 RepID=A0A8K0N4H4_COCNU|nr:cytochrome P450 90B1-like [Cocos nucifera]
MGWPLLGETIAFRKRHPCTCLGEYMEKRINKYGKIFKSNLHGAPTIVSADAELNRFILDNDGRLFEPSWPTTLVKILGKKSMIVASGDAHHYLKSLAINFMSIPRLRSDFLGDAEQSILQTFSTWVEHTPFPLKEEAIKMSFNLIVKHILSKKPGEPETEQLRKLFMCFMRGVVSMPINLPGTAYRKALKEEHIQIVKLKKERGETGALTWQDYKKMEFTRCIVSETLRLGNVIRFVHRKARSNIQFQGYDIPRDWNIIPVFTATHLDPSLHDEPHKFNPWRWQTLSASTTRDDSYMAFSHGIRRCPGQELAKMEITIFLHHFVLNFDWELAELDHPLASPFPEFPKGLPIKVHKLSLDM